MGSQLCSIAEIAAAFLPISLDEMQSVRLMNRTDTKFVISLANSLSSFSSPRIFTVRRRPSARG